MPLHPQAEPPLDVCLDRLDHPVIDADGHTTEFVPALAEYLRCFRNPDTIRGSCEDYRAAASIDLEHDRADRTRKIETPLLVLWGEQAFVHRHYDVLGVWADYATAIQGRSVPSGHYLPEEAPEAVIDALTHFFSGFVL